jgi:hypothetical protein
VLKTSEDYALINAMGTCGDIDPRVLCIEYMGCFTFSSYTLYKGNFDGSEENGEELFLIAKDPSSAETPHYIQYRNSDVYLYVAHPDTAINGVAASLLLNTYDNCSRFVNRDMRAVFFKKSEEISLFGISGKQGSAHALWYSKFPGETLHYGVAKYKGRDYAYEFHTKGNQYDLGIMDTNRYICAGLINVMDMKSY